MLGVIVVRARQMRRMFWDLEEIGLPGVSSHVEQAILFEMLQLQFEPRAVLNSPI